MYEPLNDVQVKELACQQVSAFSCHLSTLEKGSWWNAPACLGVLRRKDFLPQTEFQGMWDVRMVRWKETVVLALVLQRCAIWSGMPLGVLCRAVQELHRCLTPVLESGNLLDLTMLDVVEKNPMTPPVPTERASSPEPREEEPIGLPTPAKLPTLEPKEVSC